ncbi:MAG: nucleotidyl transferase AbiEii/AbiGii toxin family protein [Actinomycetota bacterium]|nr:nucleotidyl transferase AbiEii/AbiGii toxin family protein [Actinomycetota bacterium]
MRLEDVLEVLAALEARQVRYAVFGGMAMAAHGLDRATRDLDLFVAADDDNVQRLRSALDAVFDDPELEGLSSADLQGAYPAVQYGPPGVDFTIDVVSRLGEAYTFDDLELARVRAGELEFSVVSVRTLHEMKRDTVRPRDLDDAQRLARRFGLDGGGSR